MLQVLLHDTTWTDGQIDKYMLMRFYNTFNCFIIFPFFNNVFVSHPVLLFLYSLAAVEPHSRTILKINLLLTRLH